MNRIMHLVFLAAGVGLLGGVLFLPPEPGQPLPMTKAGPLAPQPLSGPAPDIALTNARGGTLKLADLRGRWVLLNFWASWCQPCVEELPHLALLAEALAGRPVVLVLASVDDDPHNVAKLADRFAGAPESDRKRELFSNTARLVRGRLKNALALFDRGEKVAHRLGTRKYPETYLIDPRGQYKAKFIGPMPWGEPQALRQLFALISPTPPARRAGRAAAPANDPKGAASP